MPSYKRKYMFRKKKGAMTTWCKMIGFFQNLEDSLCRNFSNITWRKQKCAQQPSNGPQKTDTMPQIFQKKLQRIVYVCLCYGQASCKVSSQCKFSHFLGGFAVLQISTSSLLCTGDLGRHGNASCYRDYSTHFKTIIKKANGFNLELYCNKLRWKSHTIYLVA